MGISTAFNLLRWVLYQMQISWREVVLERLLHDPTIH